MTRLTLYTTLGCHLCEQLEALLPRLHRGEYALHKVEISEEEALVERYGVRIPVLVDETGAELDMGFEPQRLADWLAARGQLDEAAWQRLQAGQAPIADSEPARAVMRNGRRYLG